jgi:N-acetylglutamate synthase-like GNAT family acetyltransferase
MRSRSLEIREATTAADHARFQELVEELQAWDVTMSRSIGLDVDSVVDFLHQAPRPDVAAGHSTDPRIFLAWDGGEVAGCAALKELSPRIAELTRVYVRPHFRGKGSGRALVTAIVSAAREAGYAKVCLESAIFMKDAHALYRSLGFGLVEPFRRVPDDLEDAEVFMELRLDDVATR